MESHSFWNDEEWPADVPFALAAVVNRSTSIDSIEHASAHFNTKRLRFAVALRQIECQIVRQQKCLKQHWNFKRNRMPNVLLCCSQELPPEQRKSEEEREESCRRSRCFDQNVQQIISLEFNQRWDRAAISSVIPVLSSPPLSERKTILVSHSICDTRSPVSRETEGKSTQSLLAKLRIRLTEFHHRKYSGSSGGEQRIW